MTMTAAFCRTQEALQRDRAASVDLENVRAIALRAASAWDQAAVLAQACEAKHRGNGVRSLVVTRPEAGIFDLLGENPDRGRADP